MSYQVDLRKVTSGFDQKSFWGQARIGAVPAAKGENPTAIVTAQPTLLDGNDVFLGLSEWRSKDRGKTWTGPIDRKETLGRRSEHEGVEVAICGMEPQGNADHSVLLSTGHSVRYSNDSQPDFQKSIDVTYAIFDPESDAWRPWKTLQMPDQKRFEVVAAGCSQRVDLEDGTLLLPVHFRSTDQPKMEACNTVAVLRCAFDGDTLRYRDHSEELTLDVPRGFQEPSLIRFNGRFYLTLRNDVRGYVTSSGDDLRFEAPRPWRFEDGSELGNYNTQQHWISHEDQLYLVYTRRGLNNDHVFRHRAPLMMARVDPEQCVVLRDTEREIVPNRGARLGNFSICHATEEETWISVAEWMQPKGCEQYGSDNTVWMARILWQ